MPVNILLTEILILVFSFRAIGTERIASFFLVQITTLLDNLILIVRNVYIIFYIVQTHYRAFVVERLHRLSYDCISFFFKKIIVHYVRWNTRANGDLLGDFVVDDLTDFRRC